MKSISEKLEILIDNEKRYQGFKNYNLNDIKKLLKHYGNPHEKIKTIHIAGTNGKGSVANIMNSILIAAGYKTGLYTSPHLSRINERIKINNKEISNRKLSDYTDELLAVLNGNQKLHPTYFDALTLFAFRYFCDKKTDIAIIETGLGGRLDSTNVIHPEVSIITDISLDHTRILGNSIQKIAREKSGIIKKNTIVATSNRTKKILDILMQKSKEESAKLFAIDKDFFAKDVTQNKDTQTFDFFFKIKNKNLQYDTVAIKNIELRLPGKFQITNSALAIASLFLLRKSGIRVSERDIKSGLGKVNIPGRLQMLSEDPLIIFDPAHNPAALKATLNAVKEIYPDKNYLAVLSFMLDKDYSSMFKIARELTKKIIYYELDDIRCLKIARGKSFKRKSIRNSIVPVNSFKDLHETVLKSLKPDSCVIITGTFRLFNIAEKLCEELRKNSEKK